MSKFNSNIFLFVPNIIGYFRVFLGVASFFFMTHRPFVASTLYGTSALLDAVDGLAARKFNQETRFGAILDQLTDRCVFLGLLMTLVSFYPNLRLFFLFIAGIDISCHWIYLHACLVIGHGSHKSKSSNFILKVYYESKAVLFSLCLANELFFFSLYLFQFVEQTRVLLKIIIAVTAPCMLVKTGISIIHGYAASLMIADLDLKEKIDRAKENETYF